MSDRSDKSITTAGSEKLIPIRSEDKLHDGNTTNPSMNEAKSGVFEKDYFENDYGECEEGYEVYKHKRERFQWSRSILEEDAYPENKLTTDEARKCLNRVAQVGKGGFLYAFVQIDVNNRNLTDIEEIIEFKYLSFINVSHNHLDLNALDVLRGLEYVVVIEADHNVVDSLRLTSMSYLQVLTLNSNKVSSLSGLRQPSLECLELNDNKICNLIQEPSKNSDNNYGNDIECPKLSTLALSRNSLETIEQFMLISINLRILFLSYNKITNLKGLENIPNLTLLHLRANQISNLDGFSENLKQLSYLNLRENRLNDTNELIKLACLKSLKTLVVSKNEFRNSPAAVKAKALKLLPWLKRIDKETINASQINAANDEEESKTASEETLYEEE